MKTEEIQTYDLVGIGFGPSNLALAAAIEERDAGASLRTLFLEQKPAFAWHPHMLLDDTVMQISFLKDLVTQRNPESRFTFINYLKSHGRLSDFINLKNFYPTRVEFNLYMAWVAERLKKYVQYGCSVNTVSAPGRHPGQLAEVSFINAASGQAHKILARNLVVAVGGQPKFPSAMHVRHDSERVWHSSQYLHKIARLSEPAPGHRFVVIGRGQSAAEIAHDIHGRFPQASVTCMFRGYGLKPSDSSEFVNGIFDSAFVDDISAAPPELRSKLFEDHQDTNYSVVDAPLITRLYEIQYRERVTGRVRLKFKNFSKAQRITEGERGVQIISEDGRTGSEESMEADTVVMATGYMYPNPPKVLSAIAHDFDLDLDSMRPKVNRNYRAAMKDGVGYGVYLQGCNEATHGLSDTLLSNLSIRAGEILGELLSTQAGTPPRDARVASRHASMST